MKRLLAGFFFIVFVDIASAQSNECEQTLSQAAEEFNAGHFYGIPAMLKSCIDHNGFSNEQRVRAYLLLCQAYLIIDDPANAEDSYLKLLRADPEYVATYEKDPVDIVYLSKKFTSTPILTPSIRLGANTSLVRTIYDNGPAGGTTRHILRPGFQFGGDIDWNINDNVSLCGNVIFATRGIRTRRSGMFGDDNNTVTERQFWIDIPVYLKYSDNKGLIRPYGYAGAAVNFLRTSKASMEFVNVSPSTNDQAPSQGPDVDLIYLRNRILKSIVVGGGVKYKIGTDFLFADVRYMGGLSNLVKDKFYNPDPKTGGALQTNDALERYVHADNYFRLDNLAISFGYIKPLYNPRKVKNARGAKSISRKIKKQGKHEGE